MANATLQDILTDIAAFINQDPTLPTGSDLTMWTNLINHAQNEWASVYQWSDLRYVFRPTTAFSGASIGLPSNFKKAMSPLYDLTKTSSNIYYQINPSERYLHTPNDKYFYILGNKVDGFALIVNPAISSGASMSMDYQAYPSSLATLTDTATCPNSEFLVRRTIASILAARSDPRFPIIKAEADDLLSNMIEEEAAPSGGEDNTTPSSFARKQFRIGEI